MQITGETDLFYVVGTPVRHFRSPVLFNEYYAAKGHNFCCAGLNVKPEDLDMALRMVRKIDNIKGLCITIPHKIAAAGLVDTLTDDARSAGSVNFVRREADGMLTGHNIDGAGFLQGATAAGFSPRGARVSLVGAGGVARAIAFTLAKSGVSTITITNRDAGKAAALARDVEAATGVTATFLAGTPDLKEADLAINATSVGMGGTGGMPFALDGLKPAAILADVVISPTDTPVITAALALRLRVMRGSAMLKPQIALSERFLYGGS